MNEGKKFTGLSKPRLDDYQPLDLFLAPEDEDVPPDERDRPRRSAEEVFADRLETSAPPTLVVFQALRNALPERVLQRLKAGRPVLIVLRLPSPEWIHEVEQGLMRVLEQRLQARWLIRSEPVRFLPGGTPKATWDKKSAREKMGEALRCFENKTTILTLAPEEAMDPSLRAFVDLEIDVTITSDHFRQMLIDHFIDRTATWPVDLPVSSIDPTWIDASVGRAETASEVVSIVQAAVAAGARSSKVRLEDLNGYGAAKEWGLRLVDTIGEYRTGRLPWSDVDAGALLVGPPGTGKTMLAEALANSCGVSFFPTSYAAWQGTKDGHLGDVMREMRKAFSAAAAAAPSLLFIDEIDSLPARGTAGRYDDWWRSIVNCLLECLDGAGRREGVVVLAACNDGRNLDSAITRSGRLDRQFTIGLPGEIDLVRIFQHHLPTLHDADVQPVAAALAGSASGADAARLAREARQIARTQKRDVGAGDLVAVAIPADTRSDAVRRRIAVHEAGHATALFRLGIIPDCLSIIDARGGSVTYKLDDEAALVDDIDRRLQIHLAGRAAEEIVLGNVSGGAGGQDASDLGQATTLVANAEARLGLGGRISMSQTVDETFVEGRLRVAYANALVAAIRDRRIIEDLAAMALQLGVLGRRALEDFWAMHDNSNETAKRP